MNYPSINVTTFRKLNKLPSFEKDAMIYKLSSDLEKSNKRVIILTQKNRDLRNSLLDYNLLKDK